ncbi:MAG: hypothetical protein JXB47_14090, partial [Anaerolineae bacterium]|nr:hypothetical protein [Anaerolineae bacterium]
HMAASLSINPIYGCKFVQETNTTVFCSATQAAFIRDYSCHSWSKISPHFVGAALLSARWCSPAAGGKSLTGVLVPSTINVAWN